MIFVDQDNQNFNTDKMTYTIKDIQTCLGIGKNNAYKLIRLPNFPVIKIGKRYIIPRKEFEIWLSNSVNKELLQ